MLSPLCVLECFRHIWSCHLFDNVWLYGFLTTGRGGIKTVHAAKKKKKKSVVISTQLWIKNQCEPAIVCSIYVSVQAVFNINNSPPARILTARALELALCPNHNNQLIIIISFRAVRSPTRNIVRNTIVQSFGIASVTFGIFE